MFWNGVAGVNPGGPGTGCGGCTGTDSRTCFAGGGPEGASSAFRFCNWGTAVL